MEDLLTLAGHLGSLAETLIWFRARGLLKRDLPDLWKGMEPSEDGPRDGDGEVFRC
jgi:hypothetical protein